MQTINPAKRRRSSFQFSLRTLLVLMTVACLVSGFWLNKAIRQQEAVRRFKQLTANRPDSLGDHLATTLYCPEATLHSRPILPEWLHPLRDLIGEEAFGEVIGVQLTNTPTTNEDLRYLADVSTVEQVWLSDTRVTDEGIQRLHACPRLRFLTLDNTAITDEGLARLTALTELESLSLNDTKVSNESVPHLAELRKLKELWLHDTAISDSGYRRLEAALPECDIRASHLQVFQRKVRERLLQKPLPPFKRD